MTLPAMVQWFVGLVVSIDNRMCLCVHGSTCVCIGGWMRVCAYLLCNIHTRASSWIYVSDICRYTLVFVCIFVRGCMCVCSMIYEATY